MIMWMGDDTLALELDGTPGSVRSARRAARRFLTAEESCGLANTAVLDVLMVVGELVANACRHAPGPCRLTVVVCPDAVHVAVRDGRPVPVSIVRMRPPSGYGLFIVARLTRGIEVLPVPGGKIVRADVPLRSPRPAHNGAG